VPAGGYAPTLVRPGNAVSREPTSNLCGSGLTAASAACRAPSRCGREYSFEPTQERRCALPPCRLAALPPRRLAALPRSVEAHPGTMFHPPDELTGGAGDEPSRVRSTHGIEAIDRRGRGRHDGGAASLRRSDADRRSRRDHGHRTKAAGATGLDHLGHRQGHRAGGRAPSRRARPAERGGQPGPWPGRCRRPAPGIRGRHPRLRSRPPPDRPPPRRSSWVAGAGGCWTRSRSASRSR
jgi:hypothetical protein